MELKKLIHNKYRLAGVSIAGVVLMQVLISACQQTAHTAQTVPPAETANPILPTPAPDATPSPLPSGKKTIVYHVVPTAEGSHLEQVTVDEKPVGRAAAMSALNEMARMKDSPLPKGTKALSVKFSQDLATVNFNKAITENFEGGDEREALMLNAITATLGQFPDVKQVQLLVEGKKEQIGGTQDTTAPLDVPPAVTQVSQKTADSSEGGPH